MEMQVTVNDPKAYSRPWTSDTLHFTLQPDTELLEHLCENNRDLESLQQYWKAQEQANPALGGNSDESKTRDSHMRGVARRVRTRAGAPFVRGGVR